MTAPKIDTQAPDALRDWPEWMDLGKQRCGWSNIAAEPGNMMRYSRADLAEARAAAAWIAGRDAAANETERGWETAPRQHGEMMQALADNIRDLQPPTDLSAALADTSNGDG